MANLSRRNVMFDSFTVSVWNDENGVFWAECEKFGLHANGKDSDEVIEAIVSEIRAEAKEFFEEEAEADAAYEAERDKEGE